MSLFGQKRLRTHRTVSPRTSSLKEEILGVLRNRNVMLRLTLCLAAVAMMTFAVKAWESPFPYRLEYRPARGIIAQTDFERVNAAATRRTKERAAEDEPFVFQSDGQTLRDLPGRLRADLLKLAGAANWQQVPAEMRTLFGLVVAESVTPQKRNEANQTLRSKFVQIKQAIPQVGDIDKLIGEFRDFLAPVQRTGFLLPSSLPTSEIVPVDRIAVVTPDGGRDLVDVADVGLHQLLAPSGALGKSWSRFPELSALQKPLENWLHAQALTTLPVLRYDADLTRNAQGEARDRTENVKDVYKRGDILVEPGESIDEEMLAVLQAEFEELESQTTAKQRMVRVITVFIMILMMAALNGHYLVLNEPALVRSLSKLAVYLGVIVIAVAGGRLLSFDPWRMHVIPLTVTVMIFAIAYNQLLAVLTAFSLGLVLTLSIGAGLEQFIVLTSVCAISVILLPGVHSRSTLIVVGFWAGLTYCMVHWGTGILAQSPSVDVWSDSAFWWEGLRGFAWCLVCGFLVAGSLPFIEPAFGIVTDISLLELSDVSHPLLQELVRRAPGTYNHSMSVATIGEAAADHIGANGLLVRVGAYFHDIGKMLKPHYFVENIMSGAESRHDHLAPAMSTLIIIGHVKDGVDLARQHNLPERLIDFIEQHHGTTLVEYFYREAAKQADKQLDHKTDAEESSFRYPGRKPQTRELAVMMLADAVESASRTLSEPTPKRIESLVHEITMKRLLDGQFEESGLTLTEIHMIEQSLVKSLIGTYHGRIKYPEQKTA